MKCSCDCLCCAVLCCAVLCCAVLCCAVLCCAVLCFVGWAEHARAQDDRLWCRSILVSACVCMHMQILEVPGLHVKWGIVIQDTFILSLPPSLLLSDFPVYLILYSWRISCASCASVISCRVLSCPVTYYLGCTLLCSTLLYSTLLYSTLLYSTLLLSSFWLHRYCAVTNSALRLCCVMLCPLGCSSTWRTQTSTAPSLFLSLVPPPHLQQRTQVCWYLLLS